MRLHPDEADRCKAGRVTDVEVVGLSDDGERVLLRLGDEHVEVPLTEIRAAERRRSLPPLSVDEPLTPRLIQHRIRSGESADDIARTADLPVATVARYEGPALAERNHHARLARAAEVDGNPVEALVLDHLGEPADAVEWDAWLTTPGRWEVQARAAGRIVRLRWDPAARRVTAADDASRRALKQAAAGDALTAVLRPLSTSATAAAVPPPPARPARRARAEVPLWEDISLQVTGRAADPRDGQHPL